MKIFLLFILSYSYLSWAEQKSRDATTKKDFEQISPQMRESHTKVKEELSQLLPLLDAQNFTLKSIDGRRFLNSVRGCIFESQSVIWDITYCGPSYVSNEGKWHRMALGSIHLKDGSPFQIKKYHIGAGNHIYHYIPYISPLLFNTVRGGLSFILNDEEKVKIKLPSSDETIMEFVKKLTKNQYLLIEKSFQD